MKIKDIQDAMSEVEDKTGRYCHFKISNQEKFRRFETYISLTQQEEEDGGHNPFVGYANPTEALNRFEMYVVDRKHEVIEQLEREKNRLLNINF